MVFGENPTLSAIAILRRKLAEKETGDCAAIAECDPFAFEVTANLSVTLLSPVKTR